MAQPATEGQLLFHTWALGVAYACLCDKLNNYVIVVLFVHTGSLYLILGFD
jgi:hypothetical protein